jgi:hypothetical protein
LTLTGQQALLFVNKKKQKNFDNLGLRRTKIPAQEEQKFFSPLFFKKAAAVFL